MFEAADHAQGGGLAAAGRTEERVEASGVEGQRNVIDRAVAGKIFADAAEFEDGLHWVITYLSWIALCEIAL